jgi:hypothetical protein
MLKYSERALPGIVKIFERFNDLNIFVEDITQENFYKVLFQRLLGPDINISKIFKCNGRLGVISAANELRYRRLKRKFFMIDGDIFLICGEKNILPVNVFRLDMYCIENGLLCFDSIVKFAYECEPDRSLEEISKILHLKKWFDKATKMLVALYIWYAAAMHFSAQIKTLSIKGTAFLKPNTSDLDKARIQSKIFEIREHLEYTHGKQAVSKVVLKIKQEVRNFEELGDLISAKSYLFPLVIRHLKVNTAFSDERGLVMRLCHCCSLDRLDKLRNALIASLGP